MKYLPLLLALLISGGCTKSEPDCSSTIYNMADDTIQIGTPRQEVDRQVRSAFGDNIKFNYREGMIQVVFNNPYKNLDGITYFFTRGRVSRIGFIYNQAFLRTLGGRLEAYTKISVGAVEKYKPYFSQLGESQVLQGVNNKSELTTRFPKDESGMIFEVYTLPPGLVMTQYECASFEAHLAEQPQNLGI